MGFVLCNRIQLNALATNSLRWPDYDYDYENDYDEEEDGEGRKRA